MKKSIISDTIKLYNNEKKEVNHPIRTNYFMNIILARTLTQLEISHHQQHKKLDRKKTQLPVTNVKLHILVINHLFYISLTFFYKPAFLKFNL